MRDIVKILGVFTLAVMLTVSCKDKNASSRVVANNVENASDRDAVQGKYPVMSFEKTEHDFGTIESGARQETVFKFTNTGKAPLIITDARSSCGCTVPDPPKEPIAPGEDGELLVKFNGNGKNQVTKTITVTANTEKGSEILKIKAFVNSKEDEALSVPLTKTN